MATPHPTPSNDELSPIAALFRLVEVIRIKADDALRPMGINFARYEFLALIEAAPDRAIAMKTAAAELNLPPATVTHTVTQLEKQGLVRRMRDPEDGRGILVGTSDKGAALVAKATPKVRELFNRLDVPQRDQRQLLKLATSLRQAATKL